MRTIGTVVRGVRAPIIREGDNIAEVAAASVMEAWKEAGIEPRDRDVVAVTESVVARAQGNYATLDQIAKDVREKTGGGTVGVAFPILSRNRFSLLLRGMAMGCKKIVLLLSYPSDEVGNGLVDWDKLDEAGVDPYSDVLTLEQFRKKFGAAVHPFTGVDYIDFYSGIITDAGAEVEVIFGNRVQTLCDYTDARHHLRHPHPRAQQAPAQGLWRPRGARPRRSAQQKRRRQRLQRRIRPARLQQGDRGDR